MATDKRTTRDAEAGQGQGGGVGGGEGQPQAIDPRERQRGDQVQATRKPQSATVAEEPQGYQQQIRPPRGTERTSLEDEPTIRSEPNKARSSRGPSSLRASDVPGQD
jgi:hypothetical protein